MKQFYQTFAILIVFSSLALGVSSTSGQEITWSTIDGGGNTLASSGGGFDLAGTIGQPDAGSPATPMTGGAFQLVGGFWNVTQVCYCPGDMNGDGTKNGLDVQKFVNCVISGGACSCADLDLVGGVTPADVSQFVAELLASQQCP